MTNSTDRVEIIPSVQRRRRWTAPEKVRMVEETFEPGMTVSLVARRHGVAPNQLFTWRRLVAQGSLTKRSWRLLSIGLCRTKFANFIGCWARRRWKRKSSKRLSNMPQGQKNNCGYRRRRRRTVPDEDRGRGHRRLPLQSCGPSPGTVQEADRTGRGTGRGLVLQQLDVEVSLVDHAVPAKCRCLAAAVKHAFNVDFKVELAGRRAGDPTHIIAASDRARDALS